MHLWWNLQPVSRIWSRLSVCFSFCCRFLQVVAQTPPISSSHYVRSFQLKRRWMCGLTQLWLVRHLWSIWQSYAWRHKIPRMNPAWGKEATVCSLWPSASALWWIDEQTDISVLVCICSTCDRRLCVPVHLQHTIQDLCKFDSSCVLEQEKIWGL